MATGNLDGEVDEYEQGVLYEDGSFRVTSHPRDPEAHNLWIGKCDRYKRDYFFLPRGVLEEIAERDDESEVKRKIEALYQGGLDYSLKRCGASAKDLMVVFARARLREMEEMFHLASKDAREYKQKLLELEQQSL